jgi:hypothetical protein
MIASVLHLAQILPILIVSVQLMIQLLHVPVLSILPVKTATAKLMPVAMIASVLQLAQIQPTLIVFVLLMIQRLLVLAH